MSRRGENIYKRQDGRWEARYIKERDLNGRAVYGYIYRRSYIEAKRAQSEARANCNKSKPEPQLFVHSETLEEYLSLWLQSNKISVKKSTFANYDGIIRRHIVPFIGKIPLNQINSKMIQQYINKKLESGRLDGKGGLSVKTARDISDLLKRSLKTAGIELNFKLPKYTLPKLRVLTHEEQSALISVAKCEKDLLGLGTLISLFTGIRIGELCSLKWGDVSLDDGILKINKTIQRIKNCGGSSNGKTIIDIGTPKSECSVRDIPLPHFLLCRLAQLKKTYNDNYYILSGDNQYVEPRLCQYRFKRLVKSAGISNINFHVLRHTFATRCVELGVDVKTISKLLGHSNVNITLNRYVHPAFEHQRGCLEKLSISF
ncbi:MAG: site-specific integrase [Dehalobacterium sp.]